jgi:hypothetical protein
MRDTDLEACVIRLEDGKGQTWGTGFVVSPSLAVTCAHVVEACGAGLGERVRLVFHAGGEPVEAEVLAESWHPEADVAFLRLPESLPEGVTPATLSPSVGRESAQVRAFGYPEVGQIKGLWGTGELTGRVKEVGQTLLQLSSAQITKGFSGGPVWDEATSRVIGMVTQIAAPDRYARLGDMAFAVPAETLRDLHPAEITLYYTLPPGTPFQAPTVPRYFIPRLKVSQALTDYLTADAPPGALVVSAVHGLGGIGKTTLVAALAHDPAVQTRFPDGVLWVTLGQEPDTLSFLSGWIQTLGDYDFRATVVEMASSHLRALLHDKACLLVVDDAWQADHVRSFLVGGDSCRVLVTTRDAALARKVGAQLYDLDVMTEAQALALFEARLGTLDGGRGPAAALARELGYLPLALELAAAQIEVGVSWDELLAAFREGLADLAALDLDEATFRNESLRLSFRLSLKPLSPKDQNAFAWLGVLPEDARLNPAMAATLWDQPEMEARKRLRRLRDKALLKAIAVDEYTVHDLLHDEAKLRLKEQMPLPKVHALLLDRYKLPYDRWDRLSDDGYIHQYLTWHMEQAGQSDAIHALLRLETQEGHNAWYQAREALAQTAGYLDDVRRAWRLVEEEFSARHSQLAIGLQCRDALIVSSLNSLAHNLPPAFPTALVKEGVWTPSQALAYVQQMPNLARKEEALVALAPYLPDSLLEKTLAMVQEMESESSRTWVLVALVSHLPESLLHKVLAVVQKLEDESNRIQMLSELAPHLRPPLLREALALAGKIENERWRIITQLELASQLPETENENLIRETIKELMPQVVELAPSTKKKEILAAAQQIADEWLRVAVLAGLILNEREPLKGEALQALLVTVRKIEDEIFRTETLAYLAPQLTELGYSKDALTVVREIEDEWLRVYMLIELVPNLPEPLNSDVLREALVVAHHARLAGYQVEELAKMALRLPGPSKSEALQQALVMAREIQPANHRAEALAGVAVYLAEPLKHKVLHEALATVRKTRRRRPRAEALARLAPRIAQSGYPEEALAIVREIRRYYDDCQAEALTEMVSYLPGPLLMQALEIARDLHLPDHRAKTLAALAVRLSEAEQEQVFQEALAAVREIRVDWEGDPADVLDKLVVHLSKALLCEALALVRRIGDSEVETLIELAVQLVELGKLKEALTAAHEIQNMGYRTHVQGKLINQLVKCGYLEEALATAREIQVAEDQVNALAALVPSLSGSTQAEVLRETLAAVKKVRDPRTRAITLGGLVTALMESGCPEEALKVIREIEPADRRVEVLKDLIHHLTGPLKGRALQGALVTVRTFRDAGDQAEALVALIPHLTEPLREKTLQEALATAWEIQSEGRRAMALLGIASYLPEAKRERVLQEILVTSQKIENEWVRADTLAKLASHLPKAKRKWVLQEALAAVRMIHRAENRAEALGELALHLPETEREQVFKEALAAARKIGDADVRAGKLIKFLPRLSELLLREALAAARKTRRPDCRAKILRELAFYLPEAEQGEILQEALLAAQEIQEIGRWCTRSRALADLAPHLAEMGDVEEALRVAREIGDEYDRSRALTSLAPRLPQAEREGVLREALAAAREIEDEYDRSRALAGLGPYLAEFPRTILFSLWRETLRILSTHRRRDLLGDIRALAPVVAALGGGEAVVEIIGAIQDVFRWWP